MKIEYLREYVELAKTKNYSKTAEKFFLSQSALSKHISNLETELGCDLINHSAYGLEFTALGDYALKEFADIIQKYDTVKNRAEKEKNGLIGELRIGVLYYQSYNWILPILNLFRERFPEIKVKTVSGQPDQIYNMVLNGTVDAAFLFRNPDFLYEDTNMAEIIPVFSERVIALFSPQNPLGGDKHSIKLSQLSGEVLLRNEVGPYMQSVNNAFEGLLEKKGIRLAGSAELENIDFLTNTITETNSFLVQGGHIRDFYQNLGYAEISDLAPMQTCIFVSSKSSNPSIECLKDIVPEVRSGRVLLKRR